jgi:hypothetical protein
MTGARPNFLQNSAHRLVTCLRLFERSFRSAYLFMKDKPCSFSVWFPKHSWNRFQNLELYRESRSDAVVIWNSMPSHYLFRYSRTNSFSESLLLTCRKCADFVSRSIIIQIASCFAFVFDNPSTKSIAICSISIQVSSMIALVHLAFDTSRLTCWHI